MNTVPQYWKTSLAAVDDAVKEIKRGRVEITAYSAGKRPIYKIEYGESGVVHGRANLSSALGARDIKYFADKSGEDYKPTLFLVGCMHGGEFEGVSAILNLIKLMETGTDYAGREERSLVSLMKRLHLVIIPVANPDGRARVPFDSFVGKTFSELRYYNQGTWKNGELCGWPGCKMIHPIKDYCEYLGAYFNDDGVNMMHEDFFGKVSNESEAVLNVGRTDAPDLSVLLHGGTNSTPGLLPLAYGMPGIYDECIAFSNDFKRRCDDEGVRATVFNHGVSAGFGFKDALHHVCATPVLTFESNQGLTDAPGEAHGYDEIYKAHVLLFEEAAKHLLAKFSKE